MQNFEVEIKALLGSAERAAQVRAALRKADPHSGLHSKSAQLNHYFEPDSDRLEHDALEKLGKAVVSHLGENARAKLENMIGQTRAKEYSVRTRLVGQDASDGEVFLVIKATMGTDSSANGVARMEFEERVWLSLEELDRIVLSCGFRYQAKWSREREAYTCKGINVTLDKNAGYGWLAEFERIVPSAQELGPAEVEVRALMAQLGVEELPQARLERMFAHYNKHWQEYYGTDRIFVVE